MTTPASDAPIALEEPRDDLGGVGALRGARLRLAAERLEDHLGVEVVALLAERVEQRRQRLGQVLRERVASRRAELHVALHLDAGLLEQRLQRVAREQARVLGAARVAHDARVARDGAAHLGGHARPVAARARAPPCRPRRPRPSGSIPSTSTNPGGSNSTRAAPPGGAGPHRHRDAVLVERDGADRARGSPPTRSAAARRPAASSARRRSAGRPPRRRRRA